MDGRNEQGKRRREHRHVWVNVLKLENDESMSRLQYYIHKEEERILPDDTRRRADTQDKDQGDTQDSERREESAA